MDEQILGLSGERVDTRGYIDLYMKFGEVHRGYRTIMVRYLIIDATTSYNVLLGRLSLSKLGAIVSTPHPAMKFCSERWGVATMHVEKQIARECYVTSLRLTPTVTSARRQVNQRMVVMTNWDNIVNNEIRVETRENMKLWQLGKEW